MSKILINFCLIIFFVTAGVGCSENSTPSESLLQSSLSEAATNDAKGLISFSDVSKLDGQLQSDGLNYLMGYEARFTINKCIEYITYVDSIQDLPFNVLKEKNDQRWCAANVGNFDNYGSGRFWGMWYEAVITGQLLFTKKEKGWALSKVLLPLQKIPGAGKLAWKGPNDS